MSRAGACIKANKAVAKGRQHSQGGKGTDICSLSFGHSLSLLSYSTSKLTLLHSNAAPTPPPQLRVINRLQNILIYIHKCHQNENYPDMNSFCCWCCLMSFKAFCASERYDYSLMYVLFYHIQCLICVIKRGDGFTSEDGEVTIIRAVTRLTHLSDYQLAPVHFIVCTYTLKITVILLNFFFFMFG